MTCRNNRDRNLVGKNWGNEPPYVSRRRPAGASLQHGVWSLMIIGNKNGYFFVAAFRGNVVFTARHSAIQDSRPTGTSLAVRASRG